MNTEYYFHEPAFSHVLLRVFLALLRSSAHLLRLTLIFLCNSLFSSLLLLIYFHFLGLPFLYILSPLRTISAFPSCLSDSTVSFYSDFTFCSIVTLLSFFLFATCSAPPPLLLPQHQHDVT